MAKKKEKIKLTRAEKKQLQELMTRRQQQSGKKGPRTAQDTIPYQRMWPDGICRVTDNYYTKTIQFQDINYQLAQNDDKTSIFEGWCDFLNYFDASIHLQFSFLNLTASAESFEQSISVGSDVSAALWTCIGYTVLLCFTLFKSSSVAKSIFNAH